jgi:hypothetical protein
LAPGAVPAWTVEPSDRSVDTPASLCIEAVGASVPVRARVMVVARLTEWSSLRCSYACSYGTESFAGPISVVHRSMLHAAPIY